MSDSPLPTRWIACVDGTWCTPDGAHGKRHGNISNVYRICASVQSGECIEQPSGLKFSQRKKYYNGIGSEDDLALVRRLEAGALGSGFSDQIREVYKDCCLLPDHHQNEIWLFGFSRGAYVVRAVASLIHHVRILSSAGTPQFDKDFEHALQVYRAQKGHSEVGKIHNLLAGYTRKAPRIQFVGVFDTVKALDDGDLYDISFNDSIQHVRHALSLHENRRAFRPEYYFPDLKRLPLARRSIVQAWFVGAHIDSGGSAAKDGLSLYPLQWMLIESRAKGLRLEFDGSFGNRAVIDDPLKLAFPAYESEGKGAPMATFTIKNGLKVEMQDLRRVHELPKYELKYAIHLNQSKRLWMPKEQRAPFNEDGNLKGYCEYAAQGTIIHPSVYLVFDEHNTLFLASNALSFRNRIEQLRDTTLTKDVFWEEKEIVDNTELGAIRILVCGNTGVGKSTLINEVFGAELTAASERVRGIHDIRTPLVCENRPDLIIHDSGGFESGGDDEFQQVKEFVNGMSSAREMKDRLHVIWLCIEMNSARVQQKAAVDFFTILSQNSEIPIVAVQTKKDEFWDLQFAKAWKKCRMHDEAEAYANEQLQKRMIQIEEDLSDIKDSRCDAVVSVSKDDKASIRMLAEETGRCFDHEKVRMLYVAAQVARVDLKVDLAVTKTMQIYKGAIKTAGGMASVPMATTTNRVTVAAIVCTAVVNAFGVPSVTAATIRAIVKSVVWDDMGGNFTVFLAECIAVAGVFGTIGLFGAPVFLAAGAINAPIAIIATAELLLMLSCDLILILRRAFKDCTHQCLGQPLKSDIEKAALAYREVVREVHKELKSLLPAMKIHKAFQSAKIRMGLEQVITKYTESFVERSDGGVNRHGSRQDSLESGVSSIDLMKAY